MSRLIDAYCEYFRKYWMIIIPFCTLCLIGGLIIGMTFGR